MVATYSDVAMYSRPYRLYRQNRPAELMAKFLDVKLKGEKGLSDDDVESVLDKVMVLFRYESARLESMVSGILATYHPHLHRSQVHTGRRARLKRPTIRDVRVLGLKAFCC